MAIIDSLAVYYKLEDVNDASGAGKTLTNTGSVSFATAGKIDNSAGTFNTSQRLGRTSDNLGITATSDYSVNFWVNFTSASGAYIFDFWTQSGGQRRDVIYMDGTKFRTYLTPTDNPGVGSAISTATWYMVTMTKISGAYTLYVNTTGYAQTAGSSGGAFDRFSIGNPADSFGAPVNGIVDELGVWNKGLTTTEISELYNSGAGLQYPFTTSSPIFPRLSLLGVGR